MFIRVPRRNMGAAASCEFRLTLSPPKQSRNLYAILFSFQCLNFKHEIYKSVSRLTANDCHCKLFTILFLYYCTGYELSRLSMFCFGQLVLLFSLESTYDIIHTRYNIICNVSYTFLNYTYIRTRVIKICV